MIDPDHNERLEKMGELSRGKPRGGIARDRELRLSRRERKRLIAGAARLLSRLLKAAPGGISPEEAQEISGALMELSAQLLEDALD